MSVAFVFPGQGSQAVGMGKALADAFAPAREVFEEVDAALGEKLTRIIWEGPAETLTLTENAQPALMAVSLAAMRVLETQAGVDLARDAQFVAGHSLGEYSALAAAGALTIADTARLVRIRGRAMQKAVPVGTGAMAALLGLEFDDAAGLRSVPLRADAARRRRHGAGAGRGRGEAAGGAGGRQCAGQAGQRFRRDRARACRPGHRHGALARVGRLHGRAGRDYVLRGRSRQGAERSGQAHRRWRKRRCDRVARGCGCLQGGARLASSARSR